MIKSKYSVCIALMIITMLFALGNWVMPAQANTEGIGTPTPTDTPDTNATKSPGVVPPAEEQEELKNIVRAYIDIRYRALSVSGSDDFKRTGFGSLISETHEARDFLSEEMAKLAVEVRRAELNGLRYADYKYFLDFRSIAVDPSTQTATILVVEGSEVIFEISVELKPEKPTVTYSGGVEHIIVLRRINGQWKIISDTYNDDLWRMLRHAGKSTDEFLRASERMIRILEASPRSSAIRTNITEAVSTYTIPDDLSSHAYDRAGAVDYAADHWGGIPGFIDAPYNPNYFAYPATDCQNFVSQALYEGGNITMFISPWSVNLHYRKSH